MYILLDWLSSIIGGLRWAILWLDSVGLVFIDKAYDLLISAMKAFDETAIKEIATNITHNVYIIIGIFALFRIAVILVNTIISPDKLTDKESGFGNVLGRFVITICLFVVVPFIFDASRTLQSKIMDNNYISKVIIGKELTGDNKDANSNPGDYMKDLAVRALIHPDGRIADEKNDYNIDDNAECAAAVKSWKNDAGIDTLQRFIGDFDSGAGENGEDVYCYSYTPFVTLLVGGFMTYVLFSFAIDIAVRSVELLALEILAPLFIVTFIDPKSGSNGAFKKWTKTCMNTFVSLFIKVGIVCLMLLFMSNLKTLMGANDKNGAFLNLLMMIAILIFAKKAPKWIGDMLGVEGGLGGLYTPKKLRESMAGYGAMKTAGAVGAAYVGNRLANRQHNKAAKKAANDAIDAEEDKLGRRLNYKERHGIKKENGATYAQKLLRNTKGRMDALTQGIKTGKEAKGITNAVIGGAKLSSNFRNDNLIGEKGIISLGIENVTAKIGDLNRFAWGDAVKRQEREKALKSQKNFENYYTPKGREGISYNNSPTKQTAFNAEYMGLGSEDGFYAAEAIKRDYIKKGIDASKITVSIDQNGIPTVKGIRSDGSEISQVAGPSNGNYGDLVKEGHSLVTKQGADFISDAFKGMQEKAIGDMISANQNIATLMSAKSDASNQVQQSAKALTDALNSAGLSVSITGKSAEKISEGISAELSRTGKTLTNDQVANIEKLSKNYESDQFNENNISNQMQQYAESLKKCKSAIDELIKSKPDKYANKTYDELLVIIQNEKKDTEEVLKSYEKSNSKESE